MDRTSPEENEKQRNEHRALSHFAFHSISQALRVSGLTPRVLALPGSWEGSLHSEGCGVGSSYF